MEKLRPQKRIKREQLLIQLKDHSSEIQRINNDIFTNTNFQLLLFFCNQHKNYIFTEEYIEKLINHPIQSQYQYFANIHNQIRGKKITYDKQIADKLKLLLQQNRITPKILTLIKVKENAILLKGWSIQFYEEIMKAFDSDDYLIRGFNQQDSEEIIEKYSEAKLILKLLEQLLPFKEKYITNDYLTNSDILQIKETHQQMTKINCNERKSYKTIFKCFDLIVNYINESAMEFDNEAQLNRAGPLKKVIYRKIGKIYLLELVKNEIGLPRILQQISLLDQSQQNSFGEYGTINVKFSLSFLDYLSRVPELAEVTEQLDIKNLGKLQSWKSYKMYYFSNILQTFQEYEKYTEDDCLQLQLEFLLQRSDRYKEELKKYLKSSPVSSVISQIEQRIHYFLDKDLLDLNSSVFQIGLQLINLKKKIIDFEPQFKVILKRRKESKYKYVKKPPVQKYELDNPQQEYRNITVMLTSQRMKFSYLIKFFISNLVKDKQPYPFIISIVKCHRFLIRIWINYAVLEYLVREDQFIKFMQEEYRIDISEGITLERIKKIVQLNYSEMIKQDLVNLSWTILLTKQADLVYENRDRLIWELEKYVKVSRFDKEVDKIQDSGDTCPKRLELSKKIMKIRDYLFKREC